jgi:transposase-like protein
MLKEPKTLQAAIVYFSNPDNAVEYATSRRWPKGVSCPTCGSKDVHFLANQRRWECKGKHPKKQFSVKVGTSMEDSAIGLDKWLCAIWMIANCKNGVSSYEIQRDLGVTQKTAWFMLHRIREGMGGEDTRPFAGTVEADETYVGGKQRNMHFEKKMRKYITGEMNKSGASGKAIVMGILERNTKQVRAAVIPEAKKSVTDAQLQQHVAPGSTLYTDEAPIYDSLPDYAREFINHTEAYVRGTVHTNTLENFGSLLKRSLAGTYVSVEPYHLQAYVNEQAFRYNLRKDTDAQRFDTVLAGVVGKRLTYEDVTGKAERAA